MRLIPNSIIHQSSLPLFELAPSLRRACTICVTSSTKTVNTHLRLLHTRPRSVRPHLPRGTPPSVTQTATMASTTATNGNSATNGTNGHSAPKDNNSKFDPNFTQHVIDLMSPETQPRHREILSSLIRHLHDFCREIELKQDEWIVGVNYVNAIGQAYKKNRNEAWRVCDILGVES